MDFQVVDKRHFANVDSVPVDDQAVEKPRYPTYVEELMARVAETERRFKEKKEQIDQEIGKIRTRLEADYDRKLERSKRDIIVPFLEILDNLERARSAAAQGGGPDGLATGIDLTIGLFRARLQALGVEPIEAVGQAFDPNVEQGVGVVPVEDAAQNGTVVEEVLRGYRLGDQLLRPAQVRVGIFPDSE
jgi:molecular chaperone GrpE